MKTLVLYSSSRGSTKRVVEKLKDYLSFPYDVINVKELERGEIDKRYELLLFFSPTYGDEELQEDMEHFLQHYNSDLSSHYFAICELGNYYGYDDFAYGAMRIINDKLISLKAKEYITPLSLDSLPKKDWKLLERWCSALNAKWGTS